MPLQHSGSGWKWGSKGKLYKGPGARAKAIKQMKAIEASQAKRAKGGK